MMAAHLQEVPKPPIVLRPGIPQTLNQIIVMALAKDPGQRFQSADAFRGALKSVPAQGAATQAGADPRVFVPSASAGSATALFPRNAGLAISNYPDGHPRLPANATRWARREPCCGPPPMLCRKRLLLRSKAAVIAAYTSLLELSSSSRFSSPQGCISRAVSKHSLALASLPRQRNKRLRQLPVRRQLLRQPPLMP